MLTPIALILHDIRSTYNVGSILRSAECFGVEKIYFSGYTPYPLVPNDMRLPHVAQKIHNQIAKTALGAEKQLELFVYENLEELLPIVKTDGYSLAALEQDTASVAISDYEFAAPTAIILGNEVAGVSDWTKSQCDVILEITQYGTKESLNVASATAIALFAARIQKHRYATTST
jgi:tRNA G18 (ribose-2'-O)-methylase SpoU